ncbi:MAG: DNA polymerase V [Piscirickettsiaceae bacterium CG_4_9_14_3_um_filter_43_564]|nr:translesion error-prone DNA polymerase V autoproteolytic subunit [Thiomicrospira sp.]OIP94165.1 MAG: DNA polymerase V [Thiomicrospira sp. CG2_30_44_34]PIQ03780.1 MAG: DNA polymerase V [Piscirickettsiaceae bacterium CG18_big_fil_WC_8_21_14_2_50_44_103]PIU39667.1 MAG: DNA polymerase V [Piscirickettsiaceae bacterium CG07_land_8_20_14_0_80_44_28]PIW57967.1 MAG: DNA polymerase V [Piscirickettsiaceae bacterium CG12_big_fil_rev_8_21_14_0_65_44_934]PIW77716.1 MAG: DNA polymerase V [Piscirickettsiac
MTQNQQSPSKAHGGARKGAGRKKGSGIYGEATQVIRVPISKITTLKNWLAQANANIEEIEFNPPHKHPIALYRPDTTPQTAHPPIPLYGHKVVAGFPSPADDYIEARLNLNDRLIRHPETTFILRVEGDSMKNAGILDGDLLLVDKSIKPVSGKIVIAAIDGELTVKRLSITPTANWLLPENDDYPAIEIKEETEITIWGVVTSTIREF